MERKGIEYEFNQLGRTAKCDFISKNIEYARMQAIQKRVENYIFDFLDMMDVEMIKLYVSSRGIMEEEQ